MITSNYKIGLILSKTNLEMSKAEAIESCKIYFEISSSKIINNLFVLELQTKDSFFHKAQLWLNRLAFTKEAFLILENERKELKKQGEELKDHSEEGKQEAKNLKEQSEERKEQSEDPRLENEELKEEISQIAKMLKDKELSETSFKVSTRNLLSSFGAFDSNHAIKNLATQLTSFGFEKAEMTSPDLEFVVINADHPVVGLKLWENFEPFEERRAHLRPVLHPTATNPRLARAMINLAGARQEILDPFCGAGGTMLEACEIGLSATGIDIDPLMIKRAELNLKNLPKIKLHEGDALTWNKRAECVITDLPYGKSSKLDGEITELLLKFLDHYVTLTDKSVVCFPEGTIFSAPDPWKIKYDFNTYIHKSLTRRIVVLEKN
ncbi:MAG: DNA methyltransferase [Candidatus Nanoarchaeia archaeon]